MSLLIDEEKPSVLENCILTEEQYKYFKGMVSDPFNKLPNMTLGGPPGIGKTTIVNCLVNEINAELLRRNASKYNSADDMRRLTDFTHSQSLTGSLKIVNLEEADCLTIGKSGSAGAQEILRAIIEESQDDTRFILTCNYPQRLIPAILSRCPLINIQFQPKQVMERVLSILKKRKIKAKKEDLETFYNLVVKRLFPKIRNIFNVLASCIINDKFVLNDIQVESSILGNDLDEFAKEFIDRFNSTKKLTDLRKFYIENCDRFEEDYIKLGNAIFKNLMDNPIAQITIADYIYKMGTVIDPEVQFYAMLLDLRNEK